MIPFHLNTNRLILVLFLSLCTLGINSQIHVRPMSGQVLNESPFFHFIDNFQSGESVNIAFDPADHESLIGQSLAIYIVRSKSPSEYELDVSLSDVRGNPQNIMLTAGDIVDNIFELEFSKDLLDQDGYGLGVRYDIIVDVNGDQELSAGDVIDGWDDERAGFFKVHNTSNPGPLETTAQDHLDNTQWLDKRIFYPEDIAQLGQLPVVIVSHGWTYDYTMYDYIGEFLSSYGYIVVIHETDVGEGGPAATHSASLTTLDNTDHFLGSIHTIIGGVLAGHVDKNRIAFIGHSTGGEAIVRAYSSIAQNEYVPQHFSLEDIKLLCPFAPVAWLAPTFVHPGSTNFHLFSAAADTDCSLISAPEWGYQQSFSIFERSTGNKQLTYIHGAGHTDLNDCTEGCFPWVDTNAPNLIGKENTHLVVISYLLPLMELYLKENLAGEEYFTRSYDDFHPLGVPEFVQLAKEYKVADTGYKYIIDDYQSNSSPSLSSSGTAVTFQVDNLLELEMRDNDNSFAWTGSQEANGFSRSKAADDPRCLVLDWSSDNAYYELAIPEMVDPSQYEYLSIRVCQGTQHPNTVALNSDLDFTISLIDGSGNTSSIATSKYLGVNRPYQRSGGWANEFESIRMRITDFSIGQSDFNMHDITAIRLEFGASYGAPIGRLGIDDIELVGLPEHFEAIIPNGLQDNSLIKSPILFPNPAAEHLQITQLPYNNSITIYNAQGVIVFKSKAMEPEIMIDISSWSSGVYFVRIKSGKILYQMKSIKI